VPEGSIEPLETPGSGAREASLSQQTMPIEQAENSRKNKIEEEYISISDPKKTSCPPSSFLRPFPSARIPPPVKTTFGAASGFLLGIEQVTD
jgi:hypothetical protein